MKPLTETHCESVYKTLHYSLPAYRNNNHGLATCYDWLHLLRDETGIAHNPWDDKMRISVIEVGCGNGKLCDFLSDILIDVTGLDIAKGPYDRSKYKFVLHDVNEMSLPFDDDEFDYCLSFDVMEHIAEEKVPFVLKEMARVSRHMIIKVACSGGPPLHLTVKSPGWWLDELLNNCPEILWQLLRVHEARIPGNRRLSPIFFGKKKETRK